MSIHSPMLTINERMLNIENIYLITGNAITFATDSEKHQHGIRAMSGRNFSEVGCKFWRSTMIELFACLEFVGMMLEEIAQIKNSPVIILHP